MTLTVPQEMFCPQCAYPVETTAEKCGNCRAIFTLKDGWRPVAVADGFGTAFTIVGLLAVIFGAGWAYFGYRALGTQPMYGGIGLLSLGLACLFTRSGFFLFAAIIGLLLASGGVVFLVWIFSAAMGGK